MLSDRIKELRSQILTLERINQIIPKERIDIAPDERKSIVIRHAEAVRALFEQVSINHIPGEQIVGNNTTKYSPRPVHLTHQEMEEIKKYPQRFSKEVLTAMDEHIFYLWSFTQGHIIPDKTLVLRKGMKAILQEIEARLQDSSLQAGQREFLEAALIECQAFLSYVRRHAEHFSELASRAADEKTKEYYQNLVNLCERVPANPATSFRDALQSVWFAQLGTQFDDVANHSLGRLDQYLYPFYQTDIERGLLTPEEAKELFLEFWLKFNLGYKLQELSGIKIGFQADEPEARQISVLDKAPFDIYDSRNGYSWLALKCINRIHTDDGQTIDIAGLTENGQDATNELSWLVLEAEDQLRTFEPKSVIKYTPKTDKAFMRKAYQILSSGFGLPAITFHEAGARGLRSYHGLYSEEDILNHSHIGCIELGIPGKSYTDPMNAFMNLPKILLIGLNNGSYDGKKVGLVLSPPISWSDFYQQFSQQLDYFVRLYCETMNEAAQFFARYYYRPLVSALVANCIERAIPVDQGGALYWTKSIDCTGFATLVDSLYSIKTLVYDRKQLSLEELRNILSTNYLDKEDFRLMIKNRIPKFGNGVVEVDELARSVAAMYAETVRRYKTFNGNSYRPGIYSFYEPIKTMGRVTGATPDGRKAGDVLSLNSAPYHGVVKAGLSNVLRSVTAIEHSRADNASVIDVQLTGETPPEVIELITEHMASKDVLYAQFTVADRGTLMEAMKHPELYQDLVVRVTGFSARFVALPKDTQIEIINRSYWN